MCETSLPIESVEQSTKDLIQELANQQTSSQTSSIGDLQQEAVENALVQQQKTTEVSDKNQGIKLTVLPSSAPDIPLTMPKTPLMTPKTPLVDLQQKAVVNALIQQQKPTAEVLDNNQKIMEPTMLPLTNLDDTSSTTPTSLMISQELQAPQKPQEPDRPVFTYRDFLDDASYDLEPILPISLPSPPKILPEEKNSSYLQLAKFAEFLANDGDENEFDWESREKAAPTQIEKDCHSSNVCDSLFESHKEALSNGPESEKSQDDAVDKTLRGKETMSEADTTSNAEDQAKIELTESRDTDSGYNQQVGIDEKEQHNNLPGMMFKLLPNSSNDSNAKAECSIQNDTLNEHDVKKVHKEINSQQTQTPQQDIILSKVENTTNPSQKRNLKEQINLDLFQLLGSEYIDPKITQFSRNNAFTISNEKKKPSCDLFAPQRKRVFTKDYSSAVPKHLLAADSKVKPPTRRKFITRYINSKTKEHMDTIALVEKKNVQAKDRKRQRSPSPSEDLNSHDNKQIKLSSPHTADSGKEDDTILQAENCTKRKIEQDSCDFETERKIARRDC